MTDKYWKPNGQLVDKLTRFREAAAQVIGGSYAQSTADNSFGVISDSLNKFLSGAPMLSEAKKQRTSSHRTAKNLIRGLAAEQPNDKVGVLSEDYFEWWDSQEGNRNVIVELLRKQLKTAQGYEDLSLKNDSDKSIPKTRVELYSPSLTPATATSSYNNVYTEFGPMLPNLAWFGIELDDQGVGNGGTFDRPDVKVQLSFGEAEGQRFQDDVPNFALANCSLEVAFDGGRISQGFYGDKLAFVLEAGPLEATSVMQLNFSAHISEASPARWISDVGRQGRRLFGRSEVERLCTFTDRPNSLHVALKIARHDIRIVHPKSAPPTKEDVVERVLQALLIRRLAGDADASGNYLLQRKALI